MNLSSRTFCLGPDDTLYALPHTTLSAMYKAPAAHPIPRFAGMRIRLASTLVEREGRSSLRVRSMSFSFMQFDSHGVFDSDTYLRGVVNNHHAADASKSTGTTGTADVSEADAAATAGRLWTPTTALAKLIHDTALGKLSARRL